MRRLVLCFSTIVLLYGTSMGAWTKASRATTSSTVTLSSVTTIVRSMIDDPISANGTVRYSSSTIYDVINTGQRLLCTMTYALETHASQALTASTTEYLLPDDCIAVTRVVVDHNDSNGPQYIPYTTVFALDSDSGKSWQYATADDPSSYYIRNRSIGFYPSPGSSDTVKVWYIKLPDVMTAEADFIFDGYTPLEMYNHALAAYAAYQILLSEGQTATLDKYIGEFTGASQSINSWIRYRPDANFNFTGSEYNNK